MICDLSNAVLLVTQTDVVSLWSAGRIHAFLQEGAGRDRLRIVLNRYKKIPGFTDEDMEKATNCKVLWKVPNNFQIIGPAINKGSPVAAQGNHEIGRSYQDWLPNLQSASASGEGALSCYTSTTRARTRTGSAALWSSRQCAPGNRFPQLLGLSS